MRIRTLLSIASVALLALLIVAPIATHGQQTSGDLVGTVLDKAGAGVPDATVTVENTATGSKITVTANSQGEYRISNLPVGTYNITATAKGFKTTTIPSYSIRLSVTNTAQITLEVGESSTTVEVTGAPPPIDTTTAQIQNTFDQRTTTNTSVATTGLGVLNLSLLQSGVSSTGGIGIGAGPSVGGQRPRNNNFTIEGVDNNNKSVTGPLVFVPNDAVQEFTALTNMFSPEFGHSDGGQYNTVVLSGTNQIHGKVYDYLENRNLNAIDQAVIQAGETKNPRFDQNRLGGQVGGPIRKNKWFYFANFEYNPVGQASVPAGGVFTPTAAGYATLATIPGVSATNLGVLQQFASPAPVASSSITVGDTSVETGVLPIAAPNFTNNYYLVTSMDYNISDKDQIRGRYIYNRTIGIDFTATLPSFFTNTPIKYHLVNLSEYHTFNPNITNEFRLGFNRFDQSIPSGDFSFPGLDSFPNLTFDELNLQLGPDPNSPQFTIQNTYQLIDNLSVVHGAHNFRLGIEGRKVISPQSFTQRARGDYEYSTLSGYLLDQTPDVLAERSLGDPVYYGDQSSIYWYVNDQWRVRSNLTLNLGVRYEYTTIPFGERSQKLNIAASVPGLIDFSEPKAPRNQFMPRIGIAWSPGHSGTTSVRAGFGMGYDVLYDNIGILSLPPQLSGTIDCPGAMTCPASGVFLASGGILPSAGGIVTFDNVADQRAATANHVVVNQQNPYSIQWTLGVEHSFGKDYTFEARYVGTRGVHLDVQQRINVQSVVTPSANLPLFTTAPSQATLDALTTTLAGLNDTLNAGGFFVPAYLNAGFDGNFLVQFTPSGTSIYHGLALQMTRHFARGLQFTGGYTYSHNIDDSTADFFTTYLNPRRPQDFQNLEGDRGNSALDRRHRFFITALYDLPYFKTGNWFKRNLVGNWEFAPIYIWESPQPFTVQSARDNNLNLDTAGDRASVINPSAPNNTSTDVTPLFNSNGDTVAYLANDPTAKYARGDVGVLSNLGKNTGLIRPINNFNLSASKRFNITERQKLEFQAQFLNLLNHPQFVAGSIFDANSFGSSGTADRNFATPAKIVNGINVFDQPQITFPSHSRVIQLALKYEF